MAIDEAATQHEKNRDADKGQANVKQYQREELKELN